MSVGCHSHELACALHASRSGNPCKVVLHKFTFYGLCFVFSLCFTLCPVTSFAFDEDFLSADYKDTALTTASWGWRDVVTLKVASGAGGCGYVGSGDTKAGQSSHAEVNGNYLYVGGNGTGGGLYGIGVFDITTNPAVPAWKNTCDSSAYGDGGQHFFTFSGNYIFATTTNAVHVLDNTNPLTLSYLSSGGSANQNIECIVSDNYLYNLCNDISRFLIFSVTGFTLTNLSTKTVSGIWFRGLCKPSANRVYVGASNGNLYIYDVTNKVNPDTIAVYNIGGASEVRHFLIQDTKLFVCNTGNGLKVYDITNPDSPTYIGGLSGFDARRALFFNNYLLVACATSIRILDISDVTNIADRASAAQATYSITQKDGYIYVPVWDSYPRAYQIRYDTSGYAVSKTVDTTDLNIPAVVLTKSDSTPSGTSVQYYISNNGGVNYEGPVTSGAQWNFSTTGSDLRWKAVLTTSDMAKSPVIYQVTVDPVMELDAPSWTGNIYYSTMFEVNTDNFIIDITWDTATDPTGIVRYEIEKKEEGGDWVSVSTQDTIGIRINGNTNAKKNWFRIRCQDKYLNKTEWKEVIDENAPQWSPEISIKDISVTKENGEKDYSVGVNWKQATDDKGKEVVYEVDYKNSDTDWSREAVIKTLGTAKSGLNPEKKHYFRVRTMDPSGNRTDWSSVEIAIMKNQKQKIGKSGGKVVIDNFDGNGNNDASVEIPENVLTNDAYLEIKYTEDGVYDISMYDDNGNSISKPKFSKNIKITIPYNTEQIKHYGWKEDDLSIYFYDEVRWIPIGGEIDRTNKTVSVLINHLSKFKIMEYASDFVIDVMPEIFTPNGDNINDVLNIVFVNRTSDRKYKFDVLNVDGQVIYASEELEGNMASWDGKSRAGKLAETGVYIIRIRHNNKDYFKTIVVGK